MGCPVGRGCTIHRLLLCRGVRHLSHDCHGYNNKQSLMLELWGMWSTPSFPSLPGPLYGSNRTKLCTYAKLNYLK